MNTGLSGLILAGSNCNNNSSQFQQSRNISQSTFKMFKVPTLNKNKKEKDITKKWKGFSVSLNRFELEDFSDLMIIGKLVLKLLMSLRMPQRYVVRLLNY